MQELELKPVDEEVGRFLLGGKLMDAIWGEAEEEKEEEMAAEAPAAATTTPGQFSFPQNYSALNKNLQDLINCSNI